MHQLRARTAQRESSLLSGFLLHPLVAVRDLELDKPAVGSDFGRVASDLRLHSEWAQSYFDTRTQVTYDHTARERRRILATTSDIGRHSECIYWRP